MEVVELWVDLAAHEQVAVLEGGADTAVREGELEAEGGIVAAEGRRVDKDTQVEFFFEDVRAVEELEGLVRRLGVVLGLSCGHHLQQKVWSVSVFVW